MISRETRVVTAEEAAVLRHMICTDERFGCFDWLLPLFIAASVSTVVVFLLYLGVRRIHEPPFELVIMAIVVGGILIALAWRALARKLHRRRNEAWFQKVTNSELEVTLCTTSSVVALGDSDSFEAYFVEVEEEQVLFLCGGYLSEGVRHGPGETSFPSTKFKLFRSPDATFSSGFCGLELLGDKLDTTRSIVMKDEYYSPENGELVKASISTLEDDLIRRASE